MATDPNDYIASLQSQKGTTRVYGMADGTVETRTGGTISWRDNNPGNLKFEYAGAADTIKSKNSKERVLARAQSLYENVIDLDLHGSVVFDCLESGRTVQIKHLSRPRIG